MKSLFNLFIILIFSLSSLGQATSISCDFETSCEVITIDSSIADNLWQIGIPDKPTFNFIPHNKLVTDTIHTYSANNYSVFYVTIPTTPWDFWMDISFEHFYDTDEMMDGGYIEVSEDHGQSWHNVIESPLLIWDQWNMYTDTNLLYDSTPGFSGYSAVYLHSAFTLWTMDLDTLLMRFVFISDSNDNQRNGWCFDYIQFFGWWEGIEEKQARNYKLYPNPVTGTSVITFENPERELMSIEIFNSNGKMIYTKNDIVEDRIYLTKDKLSKGLYIFRILNGHKIHSSGSFIVE